MGVRIPGLLHDAAITDGRGWWLEALPAVTVGLQQQWSLRVGPPFEPGGQTAWVAPATDETDGDLVLKVAWRHPEAEHEADGLALWNGNGTVRLRRVERQEHFIGLLLERCRPGSPLSTRPEPEQDVIIANLLRRVRVNPPPGGPFRPLAVLCNQWADEFEQAATISGFNGDPGLARAGIALFRSLPSTARRCVLLATDLDAGNVLAAHREPWLAIDPKPYVGDPTFDVLQHLLNCDERLQRAPRTLARRMADLLELDHDRLLLWLFARCVQESHTWPGLAEVARRIAPS